MAAVGVTSPPAPATVAAAISSSSSSPRCRVRLLPARFVAAASFRARCAAAAADGGAGAAAAEDAAVVSEGDPEASTDVAGGAATSTRPPYSLISEANVQKAMRGLAITDADHYGRLGITRLASTDEVSLMWCTHALLLWPEEVVTWWRNGDNGDILACSLRWQSKWRSSTVRKWMEAAGTRRRWGHQVKAAYEKKCEELNSRGLEEGEINKEHDLLKESFTILSTEEERRLYDWSLARTGQPERYVWPFQVDPLELAPDPPKEPEDEFPTKLVGYFFLAWFILSVALSVTLNK